MITANLGHNEVSTSEPPACFVSFAVSGATSIPASDSRSLATFNLQGTTGMTHIQASAVYLVTTLNSGLNTFTLNYREDGAFGTQSVCSFSNRNIIVTPY